ncbi:hypothetical protein ACGFMK_47930 [Amycolatopsis sp. NPDC049252]|uniref:hypothetical protein n=1 Tax=Amycolatopsis sp. NPDC049252 TaxID=3363933 RepID=UPI0037157670
MTKPISAVAVVSRLAGSVPGLVAPVPRALALPLLQLVRPVTGLVGPVVGGVIKPVADLVVPVVAGLTQPVTDLVAPVARLVTPVVTDLTKPAADLVAPVADLVQPGTALSPPETEASESVRADPAGPDFDRVAPVTVDPPLPATGLSPPVVVRMRAAIASSTAADCVVAPRTSAAVRPSTAPLVHVPGSAPPPGESAGGGGSSSPSAFVGSDWPLHEPPDFVRSWGDFVTLWRPCKPGTEPG